MADEPGSPLNGLIEHLPEFFRKRQDPSTWEVKERSKEEILKIALSHDHGITYSEEGREEARIRWENAMKSLKELASGRNDIAVINLDEMEQNKNSGGYSFDDSDIQNSFAEQYARDAMADAAEEIPLGDM